MCYNKKEKARRVDSGGSIWFTYELHYRITETRAYTKFKRNESCRIQNSFTNNSIEFCTIFGVALKFGGGYVVAKFKTNFLLNCRRKF